MAVTAIDNAQEFQLRKPQQAECSVFFNFINGKTLCMLVNIHQEDIQTIKQRLVKLASASGENPSFVVASKDLFLVWNGKPLDDDCVLADYNYSSNGHSTIFCQKRERGGCFAVSFSVLTIILMSILGSTVTCGASLFLVPLLLPLLVVLPFCCL